MQCSFSFIRECMLQPVCAQSYKPHSFFDNTNFLSTLIGANFVENLVCRSEAVHSSEKQNRDRVQDSHVNMLPKVNLLFFKKIDVTYIKIIFKNKRVLYQIQIIH